MELSLDLFYEMFGDEDDLDLFYFGVFTTDITYTPPWQKEEENRETKETRENQVDADECFEKDVKPAYISMLEELKADAEKRKRDEEMKEEEIKKIQFWWFWLVNLIQNFLGCNDFDLCPLNTVMYFKFETGYVKI